MRTGARLLGGERRRRPGPGRVHRGRRPDRRAARLASGPGSHCCRRRTRIRRGPRISCTACARSPTAWSRSTTVAPRSGSSPRSTPCPIPGRRWRGTRRNGRRCTSSTVMPSSATPNPGPSTPDCSASWRRAPSSAGSSTTSSTCRGRPAGRSGMGGARLRPHQPRRRTGPAAPRATSRGRRRRARGHGRRARHRRPPGRPGGRVPRRQPDVPAVPASPDRGRGPRPSSAPGCRATITPSSSPGVTGATSA